MGRAMTFACHALALGVLLMLSSALESHELMENRATLVMRDRTHVSMTMHVRYTEAVHEVLAPHVAYGEFLAAVASLSPADFDRQIARAHSRLQSDTRVVLAGGQALQFSNWVWPDHAATQRLFQQRLMAAVVDGSAHHHEQPTEVHAEVVSPNLANGLRVEFSKAIGRVLLVWYRPRQAWVDSGQRSQSVKFE